MKMCQRYSVLSKYIALIQQMQPALPKSFRFLFCKLSVYTKFLCHSLRIINDGVIIDTLKYVLAIKVKKIFLKDLVVGYLCLIQIGQECVVVILIFKWQWLLVDMRIKIQLVMHEILRMRIHS